MLKALEGRSNVRANLRTGACLRGTDKWGKPFDIQCESTDYSRKGMGLILDRVTLARGAVVSIEFPKRLKASAVVQWVQFDSALNRERVGVRLVNPRTSLSFKIAACILISMAVLSEAAAAKPRWSFVQPSSAVRCNVGAQEMRKVIDIALAQPGMITEAEKAFVREQHERRSCEDYTRLFEETNYYKSAGKREAMTKWHWETYHSHNEDGRGTAAQGAEASQSGGQ